MNSAQRVAKNTIVMTISSVITLVISFIFTIVFARYLGPVDYGKYAFATAFLSLLVIFSDLGLNSLTMREVARYKNKVSFYFSNSLVIEVLLSLLTLFLVFFFLKILGYPKETCYIVYVMAFGRMITTIGQISFSIFTAYEHREYEAITKIFGTLMFASLGFVGIYLNLRLIEIAVLFVISYALQASCGYMLMIWKICKPNLEVKPESWPDLLRLAVPFAMAAFFFNLYFSIDMTMLSYMKGDEVVGWYAVAYRFINLLIIVPSVLMGALWPIFSRYHIFAKDKLIFVHEISVKYLVIFALPSAFGTTLIADNLILGFFGSEYKNSIIALQILVWAGAMLFITYTWGSVLGSMDKPELTAYSLLFCLIVNVSLNLYLIPHYSYIGAASATVITELVLLTIYYYFISKNVIKLNIVNLSYKPLIASIIMGIFIYVLKGHMQGCSDLYQLIFVIPFAVAIYILLLLIFKTFTEDDIIILRNILRR